MASETGLKVKAIMNQYGKENLLSIIRDETRVMFATTDVSLNRLFIDYTGENVIALSDGTGDDIYRHERKIKLVISPFEDIQAFEFMYTKEGAETIIASLLSDPEVEEIKRFE